jgi:RimJ/RimL family protein N-acetyltransferase
MKLSCVGSRGRREARKEELVFHRTERLFLRPAFQEDWKAILAHIGRDEAIARNLARAPWPYGEKDAREFAALPQNLRLPHFLVTLPGTGVIGSAGLGEHEGEPEIGYWIGRDYWGHGFATEAAGAVLRIARTLGHRRLIAGHFIDNPASGKVLRKIGFQPTGQSAARHSCARGGPVDSVEYALVFDAEADPVPVKRAA